MVWIVEGEKEARYCDVRQDEDGMERQEDVAGKV